MTYIDLSSRRLLFGAHEGERLRDVPTSYLTWMAREIEALAPDERRLVEAECLERGENCRSRYRRDYSAPPSRPAVAKLPAGVTSTLLLDIISAGRQTLAKRLHPDAGGDVEAMKRVNVGADILEQQARALAATGGRAAA